MSNGEPPAPRAASPFGPQVFVPVFVLAAIGARLYLMATTHRTVEDFYITLRYVENLAHGLGFVYNPGERVLGTTTPLYTLLLALFARIGLDPIVCGKLVTIAASGATAWLIYRLGRAAARPEAGLLAAAIFAVWPVDLLWSISGMETSLVTMMGGAVFVAVAERRPLWTAVCAALLVLLRIDGLLLALIAFAALWRGERRFPLRAVAVFLALIAPWAIFATVYFGSPIPTSALAKLTVYGSLRRDVAFPNLPSFSYQMLGSSDARRFWRTQNPLHLLLTIGALPGLWLVARRIPALRPAALWAVLVYASLALSKVFLFGWYMDPPGPIYLLLGALGWLWILEALRRRYGAKRDATTGPDRGLARAAAIASVTVLLAGLALVPRVESKIAASERLEERLLKDTGLALRAIVPPGERLMLEPIGFIGYFSGARILDAVGLVSPEVLPYFRHGFPRAYLEIMAALRPDYVLLRAGEYRDALHAPSTPDLALAAHYAVVHTFQNPENPSGAPAFYLLQRMR